MSDKYKEEEFQLNFPREWLKNRKENRTDQLIKRKKSNSLFADSEGHQNEEENGARLPFLVSSYAFMSLNLLLIFILSYTVIKTFFALRNDIGIRINNEFQNLMYILEESKYKFMVNKCDITDIPALRKECMMWKNDMARTRNDIEVMKIVMDCFGDIIDRFLERMSWKFFAFGIGLMALYLIIYKSNRK